MNSGPKDWSPRPQFVVKIRAGHTVNGNPRRGWVVMNSRTGDMVDFVDEGYTGEAALRRQFPHAVHGVTLEVVPREYRDLLREAKEIQKKKKPNLGGSSTMAKKRSVPPVLMAWVHCRKVSGVKPGVKMSAKQKLEARSCVMREMRRKMAGGGK